MMAQETRSNAAALRHERHGLVHRLSGLAPLSPTELRVIEDLCSSARSFPARSELLSTGAIQSPQLLLSGWACYHRLLGDGRRQIVSFILPGDAIGSMLNSGLPATCTVVALTSVATIDARSLVAAAEDRQAPSGLSHLVRIMTARDEQGLRDHVVRLGRQTAYERMVHLLLDFHDRLGAAGLSEHSCFSLPLTQETLADALGLSVVHVNRTLQQIRRDGLLELRGGSVTLLQPERMAVIADWRSPSHVGRL